MMGVASVKKKMVNASYYFLMTFLMIECYIAITKLQNAVSRLDKCVSTFELTL